MRWLWLTLLMLVARSLVWANSCVQIRHVCRNSFDNIIRWTAPANMPCPGGVFVEYRLYASTKKTDPYQRLLTQPDYYNTEFVHINANALPAGNQPWSYYFVLVYTCAGVADSCYSDTIDVDLTQAETVVLDSVSVDPNTGKVVAGWRWNKSPDFWRFSVYCLSLVLPELGNTRDTIFVDSTSGTSPSDSSIKYNLASLDSCSNRPGSGPMHQTIHLYGSIDTCARKATLNWNHYVGWSAIREYHIFKEINGAGLSFLQRLSSNQNTFTDVDLPLKAVVRYYVRAIKDSPITASSSSNIIILNNGLRDENKVTYLNYISTKGEEIELSLNKDLKENISKVLVQHRLSSSGFSDEKTILNTEPTPYIFPSNRNPGITNYYRAISFNNCGLPYDTSNTSSNIVLSVQGAAGHNLLWWTRYFTWNTGVKDYTVYRESRDNGAVVVPFVAIGTTSDSFFLDDSGTEKAGLTLCYRVVANQNPGSPFGVIEHSSSNEHCLNGGLTAYFPNAVRMRSGMGSFKPVGTNIDFSKSSLIIYDRWGNLLKSISDNPLEWDLKDSSGNTVQAGIYYYRCSLVGLNGIDTLQKDGFLTIIN